MHLLNLSNTLAISTTKEQAESLLTHYLLENKCRAFAFTYYSGHIKTGRKLRYDFVSSALRPWHLHYLEQGYADVDRTLEESFTTTLPLFWNVYQQLPLAKNKREKRIRQESIAFGIAQGLSIPVYGPDHDFSTLALHQLYGDDNLFDYQTKQFEWMAAAQLFYHHIHRLLQHTEKITSPYQLTKREEQCLAYTQQSWRVEKIATALKISVRTVNFHLQNANKKMGVNNKYQAAYKYFDLQK